MESPNNPIPEMDSENQSPFIKKNKSKEPANIFWIKFGLGFLGWPLINGLIWLILNQGLGVYGASGNDYYALNLLLLPLNVIGLIVLVIIRKTRAVGFGILSAWGVNIAISLLVGATLNAICLMPFYIE